MRKLAIGRIICLIIALVLIYTAYSFGASAYRFKENFQEWIVARPMETTIDLSQPGKVSVPFHQTCSISHGELIVLDCNIKDEAGNVPDGLLTGLSASITFTDAEGNEVDSRELVHLGVHPQNGRIIRNVTGDIILADIPTFRTGDYTATIIIEDGVTALADYPQMIYARYQLCGCEQIPVYTLGFVSFVIGTIGLIVMLSVVPGLIRFGVWQNVASESVSLSQ
ncbi:hypothetical protein [Gimesia aquarii]|uniref:Uncharacterized protein n=1 Tax=Gimesia aquarii TaxID=2527964 RepID=A0A517VYX3_9PLAN|nr:hypothetical protein [Gimesia aquarii]QDT98214.1 hypothetical protein V144x_37000 [Gimesia aquarii]